jgi:hypothetical protein
MHFTQYKYGLKCNPLRYQETRRWPTTPASDCSAEPTLSFDPNSNLIHQLLRAAFASPGQIVIGCDDTLEQGYPKKNSETVISTVYLTGRAEHATGIVTRECSQRDERVGSTVSLPCRERQHPRRSLN